jgi:hypothetical protein
LLADVRGALGPHLNVFLVTQQQWSQSTVGLVTVLSGWLTLAMQTPIAAVAGAIGWRFSQRVVFLLAPVFAVLAAAAAVPIIRLLGTNLAGFPSENGRESISYKTEKALLSEPILTLLPTGI